jgi:hypothetical protein
LFSCPYSLNRHQKDYRKVERKCQDVGGLGNPPQYLVTV